MLRHLSLAAGTLGILTLAGCGAGGAGSSGSFTGAASGNGASGTALSTATLNQQEDAADQGAGQSTDAATQYLVQQATATGSSGNAITSAVARPDLDRLNAAGTVVQLSTLVDANGVPLYPKLSGSFSITSDATAVSSWPTGSNAMATAHVVVTFSAPGVTYTDPVNGAVATILSGSIGFTLISTLDYTAPANWTIQTETSTSVASSAPLSWTVALAGTATRDVTLYGYRHVLWNFARSRNLTASPAVNQLVVSRTIDGNPLSGTTAPEGVAADPSDPSQLFTNWVHTVDGGPAAGGWQSTWNRYANWQVTYNHLTAPVTVTVDNFGEEIFISRDGQTVKTTALVLGSGDGG